MSATPQAILQAWIGMGEFPSREEMSLVTLAKVREAIRAVLALLVESEAMLVEEHDARMQACQDYEDENARFKSRGGMIDRLEAERDALRLAVAKLEDERKFWAGGDAMARLKANDLRAEVERLERARLRSGDWLTLDKLDAEVAAAKDAQIEALLENVDLRAEVSRSHAAILALTGEVERLRVLVDGSVGWRCAQEQRIRAEKAEAALKEVHAWLGPMRADSSDSLTRMYDRIRAALRDTAPAKEGKP